MQITVRIDSRLMARAKRLAGLKSRRETADAALRLLVKTKVQEVFRIARGTPDWEGKPETAGGQ